MRFFWKLSSLVLLMLSQVSSALASVPDASTKHDWRNLTRILADRSIAPEWRDAQGHSAVYLHLLYGSEEFAAQLLRKAKPKDVWLEDSARLLNLAIATGSQPIVKVLLARGESPNAILPSEPCPLALAAAQGELEIIRMLIKGRADLGCSNSITYSALEAALLKGEWRAVNLLIDNGVNLALFRKRPYEGLLMFHAISGKMYQNIDILVDNGFSVNIKNSEGETPLMFAVKNNVSPYLIDNMLQSGANACERSTNGETVHDVVAHLLMRGEAAVEQYRGMFPKC